MNEIDFGVALSQLILRKQTAEQPQRPILYHYTSPEGLYGILSSGTLRASNYLYLNDTSEIEYGRRAATDFLRREIDKRDAEHERRLLSDAIRRLDPATWEDEPDPILRKHAPLDMYVVSFCEQPDLLSQWRAYGGVQGRYCIGFEIRELAGFDIVFPARVIYEVDAQTRILSETVSEIFDALRHTLRENRIPPVLAKLFPELSLPKRDEELLSAVAFALETSIDRVLCRLKHPTLAEEREWRSIVDLSNYEQSEVLKFHVGGGVVRPYVELLRGSASDPKRLPIRQIYVGYSRRPAQAKRTVELLLRHFGYQTCEVKLSEVPLVE